jgi:hypothetical protein
MPAFIGGKITVKSPGIFLALAIASAVPAFANGISFTCDPTIGDFQTGVCNYLNTSFANLYGTTFSNANASIYIEATNGGLANSTTGALNLVSYSTYQNALQSESTDAAKAFVPAIEPAIFGTGGQVSLTSALAQALGITNADHTGGNTTGIAGITAGGGMCVTPGSGGCYNGIINVNDPTDLADETGGQGYTYRTLGGSTNGSASNYDFFSIVEHETDEVLGTSSCISALGPPLVIGNDCVGNPSAVDMFRYSGSGTRAYSSTAPSSQYFSPDGGVTDTDGNLYNTSAPGDDWADFAQSCVFVQDAAGCPTTDPATSQFDITTDGPGGTAGPEVAILNAVGYDLALTAAPEPGTLILLGFGLVALGFAAYRRRLA